MLPETLSETGVGSVLESAFGVKTPVPVTIRLPTLTVVPDAPVAPMTSVASAPSAVTTSRCLRISLFPLGLPARPATKWH
jgi:hypothetical protein